ncbi:MAG TPA: cytochrome c oxidase subunit II [Solirubrobacterales bacterium]|nr:cytochrome c oxidase subunit II [Solirubrobacterales bacterium]
MHSTRQDFDGLFSLYMAIGVGVAVVVFAAVGFALVRYRAREGREPSKRSEANALEIGAATLILAIVAFLVFRTFSTEAKEDDDAAQPVRIAVTAFQWGWRFTYPGKGVSVVGNSNRQPTFAVPGDRPVSFALRSSDVIHSFWIPGQRFKRSAIPGRVNRFDLTFETPGHEEGLCAEFCGLRHSGMRFDVWVLSDASYERWLSAHR